jgi:hypothetical protein
MLHKDYDRKGSVEKTNLWPSVSRGLTPRRTGSRKVILILILTLTLTFTFEPVEVRDSNLPGCELGSRGIEIRNGGVRIVESNSVESWKSGCEEKSLGVL